MDSTNFSKADPLHFSQLMALFFAAMYLSEGWYEKYLRTGSVHSRARGIVLFDRVITGRLEKPDL
jgi:hypothetical protein